MKEQVSEEKRALIVTPETSLQKLYTKILRREGWEVYTAANIHDAKPKVASGAIRLLITDFTLLTGTGIQLIEELEDKGRLPETTILLTGFPSERIENICEQCGVHIVSKPFETREFLKVLRKALNS